MTTKSKESGWFVLVLWLLILPLAAWFGFAIHVLWGWFVVPLGVPPIGVWQAAGLGVLVGLITTNVRDYAVQESSVQDILVVYTLVPAISLLVGLLYHALS